MAQQHKLKNLSDENAVLKAIEEWNEIGEYEFLKKYGHKQSTKFQLVYEGRRYPPKAIAGAAYYHQFGVHLSARFPGGTQTNNKLKKLGFIIESKEDESTSTTPILDYFMAESRTYHSLNTILYGPPGTGKTWHTVNLSLSIVLQKEIKEVDADDRKKFNEYQFDIRDGSGQVAFTTFHQNYAYEDFVEGIRPDVEGGEVGYVIRNGIFKKLANLAEDNPNEPYVLIIDEINRGNVARIFGELITLIEDSKRLGESDEKVVILPYSQDSFVVPPNLYIIGTMNTADRSIQILDTALRRRFTFFEMMPETSHERIPTDINGINCQKILESMNRRIFSLLDRERQIGHTYFFNITTIAQLGRRISKSNYSTVAGVLFR